MRRFRFFAFALLVLGAPAQAQAQHEVSVGWAHQHVEWHSLTSNPFNGISFGYAHPLGRGKWGPFSIVGDVAITRMSIDDEPFERDFTMTGGLRWSFYQRGRLTASAEGLAGILIWREIPDPMLVGDDFIAGAGAGAHFRITRLFGARAQWHLWADHHRSQWWLMHRFTVSAVLTFGANRR